MIHPLDKIYCLFFSFNKPYVLRISIMEAEVSFEISSTIFINIGIKNAIYYYHIKRLYVSVISYTQSVFSTIFKMYRLCLLNQKFPKQLDGFLLDEI